jgi:hypothetical protein
VVSTKEIVMRLARIVRAVGAALPAMGMVLLLAAPAIADVSQIKELVSRKAEVLTNMHRKASSAIVNVAQDGAFVDYFKATDDTARAALKQRIEVITLATQANFHVGEMCLIDKAGVERTRIVGSKVATDLSSDESSNLFFVPAMAQRPRTAYVTPAYISSDVHKWVIAYTSAVQIDGQTVAVLHYEHELGLYQHALEGDVPAGGHLLGVDKGGYILADSANEPAVGEREKADKPSDYFQRFSLAGGLDAMVKTLGGGNSGAGMITSEGKSYAVAYQQVQDWTVVGIEAQ